MLHSDRADRVVEFTPLKLRKRASNQILRLCASRVSHFAAAVAFAGLGLIAPSLFVPTHASAYLLASASSAATSCSFVKQQHASPHVPFLQMEHPSESLPKVLQFPAVPVPCPQRTATLSAHHTPNLPFLQRCLRRNAYMPLL